jgi:hypothetical protein
MIGLALGGHDLLDDPTITRFARVRAIVIAVIAVALGAAVTWACVNPSAARRVVGVGPPSVVLEETHQGSTGAATFDHAIFDELLARHVDAEGWVDYAGFDRDAARLDAYIAAVGAAPIDAFGRDEKLAFLINAYNAFTIRLILDHWKGGALQSIRDIDKPWDQVRWTVGSNTWSLNQIEHEQVRPNFREPRIHFALVCAAVGCPKLRNEAFRADRLERQLDEQTRAAHRGPRWFRFDPAANRVSLTKLYDWYGDDFKQVAGSVLAFAARYDAALKQALDAGRTPPIAWLEYDWKLNDRRNRTR